MVAREVCSNMCNVGRCCKWVCQVMVWSDLADGE